MVTPNSQKIYLESADRVRRQLQLLDKTLVREMDKANREAAKPIIERAKEFVPEVPLSNWKKYQWRRRGEGENALQWDANTVKKGFKLRAGKKSSYTNKKALLQFRSLSGQGTIFEIAGRGKSQGYTPQGKAMVRNLLRKFPHTSRALWRSVDEIGLTELQKAIIKNYNQAIDKANIQIRDYGLNLDGKMQEIGKL